MNMYKKILITFSTAIVAMMLVYGGYTIYAASKDYYAFQALSDFSSVKSAYHDSINEFFNDKIDQLMTILKKPEFYKDENFKAPANVNSMDASSPNYYTKKCGDTNVSTYCVSMGALDLYMAYITTLNNVKQNIPTGQAAPQTIYGAEDILSINDKAVKAEIVDAKRIMTGTVAVYDEFRRAYPTHKQNQEIIKTLIKYKIALQKIRQTVTSFPLRFIDATSPDCD